MSELAHFYDDATDSEGNALVVPDAVVSVFVYGSVPAELAVVRNQNGTLKANPFTSSFGVVEFWALSSRYRVVVEDPSERISDRTIYPDLLAAVPGGIPQSMVELSGTLAELVAGTKGSFKSGDLKLTARPVEAGWLACDGAAVNRATYPALFAAISQTVWGNGDGTTTFNVPDFRSRSPMGSGAGPGLTARTIGQPVGTEWHGHGLSTNSRGFDPTSGPSAITDASIGGAAHVSPGRVCNIHVKT